MITVPVNRVPKGFVMEYMVSNLLSNPGIEPGNLYFDPSSAVLFVAPHHGDTLISCLGLGSDQIENSALHHLTGDASEVVFEPAVAYSESMVSFNDVLKMLAVSQQPNLAFRES